MVLESTLFSSTPNLPIDSTLMKAHGSFAPPNISICWGCTNTQTYCWGGKGGRWMYVCQLVFRPRPSVEVWLARETATVHYLHRFANGLLEHLWGLLEEAVRDRGGRNVGRNREHRHVGAGMESGYVTVYVTMMSQPIKFKGRDIAPIEAHPFTVNDGSSWARNTANNTYSPEANTTHGAVKLWAWCSSYRGRPWGTNPL